MIALRKYREKRHMTQQELAERSGVKQQNISGIENGVIPNPGVLTLQKLAVVLRCTVDDLIDEGDQKNGS